MDVANARVALISVGFSHSSNFLFMSFWYTVFPLLPGDTRHKKTKVKSPKEKEDEKNQPIKSTMKKTNVLGNIRNEARSFERETIRIPFLLLFIFVKKL